MTLNFIITYNKALSVRSLRREKMWSALTINKYWLLGIKTSEPTHLGRICPTGSVSCGWGRSSSSGSGEGCTASPPRWPAPGVGTCEHAGGGQAAAGWACASLDQPYVLQNPSLGPLEPPGLAAGPVGPAAGPKGYNSKDTFNVRCHWVLPPK